MYSLPISCCGTGEIKPNTNKSNDTSNKTAYKLTLYKTQNGYDNINNKQILNPIIFSAYICVCIIMSNCQSATHNIAVSSSDNLSIQKIIIALSRSLSENRGSNNNVL